MKFNKEETKQAYIEIYSEKIFNQEFTSFDDAWNNLWEEFTTWDTVHDSIEEFAEWLCDNSWQLSEI